MESENFVAYRKFKITLISASGLDDVRRVFSSKVYAKVIIGGDEQKMIMQTPTDMINKTNPVWNYSMEYNIAEADERQPGLGLVVELHCQRSCGDKLIGRLNTSINELSNGASRQGGITKLILPLQKGNGVVTFSYELGERINIQERSWRKLVTYGGKTVLKIGAIALFELAIVATTGIFVPIP